MSPTASWARRLALALANLALVAASLLLCVVLLEAGLRLFWEGYYLKEPKGYARPSASRGWENRPSVRLEYGEPEFHTHVSHNAFGFRGPEISRAKPADRCRVLVLGDSFAYGIGVEDDETFSARAQALESRLEVINAGVNGYGTSQQLLLLVEQGLRFAPDVVVVAFFWNDVANSYRRDAGRFRVVDGKLLYPEPPAVSQPSPARPARRRWLRHSYAYRFLSDRLKMLRFHLRVAVGVPVEEGDQLRPAEREEAWALEYVLLREIARVARGSGAEALLLVIPEQVQVQSDLRVLGLRAEDYEVQERLRAFAEAEGIPLVDPLPALRAAHARDGAPLYYLRDRHLRASGHEIVAEILVAALADANPPCLHPGRGGSGYSESAAGARR